MKAITTKRIGPTQTRPDRVVVTDGNLRLVFSRHELDDDNPDRAAAVRFITRRGWFGEWIEASTKTGSVFVQDHPRDRFTVSG